MFDGGVDMIASVGGIYANVYLIVIRSLVDGANVPRAAIIENTIAKCDVDPGAIAGVVGTVLKGCWIAIVEQGEAGVAYRLR